MPASHERIARYQAQTPVQVLGFSPFNGGSKLARRSIPPRMPPLDRAHTRRRRAASIQAPEGAEPRPDCDLDVEAVDKLIAALRPDLDADRKARLIDHFVALRDREEFRQEKNTD
jgi:hypothetical protein